MNFSKVFFIVVYAQLLVAYNLVGQSLKVSPLEEALTFSRIQTKQQGIRLLAVIQYRQDSIAAIDISEKGKDPITLFNQYGYEKLSQWIVDHKHKAVKICTRQLITPVELKRDHIGLGTNYRDHALETTGKAQPYLFPKIVAPSLPYSEILFDKEQLLDYEVELGFVALKDQNLKQKPTQMGLILCNDFTDRATLLRTLDVSNIHSGEGFTNAKSFDHFLPIGNLFVIPKNLQSFVAKLNLTLSVNNQIRQKADCSLLMWDIEKMLVEIAHRKNQTWDFNGQQVSFYLPNEQLPARSLILSGTPGGTVFQGISFGNKFFGFFRWAFGGWSRSIPKNAIELYIKKSKRKKNYLQPQDQVIIRADYLGEIKTIIK
ncbi:hypothetical protein BKI52_08250 [marine bacterium AO1-C]|nr:hypothetical protein BKI52_08250 [marine bacterium AO1-C]